MDLQMEMSGQTTAPKIFGVVGWKNSGKTTLIVALIDEFVKRGLRVSTIKHAHHDFDIDVRSKDSYRHRLAGASEVIVASNSRWALMHELRGDPAASLAELIRRLSPCDLVLVEGFKTERHPRLEVAWTRTDSLIADTDPEILAIVSNRVVATRGRPTFSVDDVPGIATFILRQSTVLGANAA
jgi:molybdopterin-guanine dinucleotide biosynthesis protein B